MRRMQHCILIFLILAPGMVAGASFEFFEGPKSSKSVPSVPTWASFEFDRTGEHLACNYEGQLYLWSSINGFENLGPGHSNSSSVGISGDGSTVIASRENPDDHYLNAAIWSRQNGWTDLGFTQDGCVKGDSWGSGFDLNEDGSQAVGLAWTCSGGEAFQWSAQTGMVGLSPAPDHPLSRATAMADQGDVVIGFVNSPRGNIRRPALWKDQSQEYLYGGQTMQGEALNISSDAGMVVGYHLEDQVETAHYWTPDEGVVTIGSLSGEKWDSSRATHVSNSGEIFGHSTRVAWGITEAFVWDRFDGMMPLQEHLRRQGVLIPDNIWLDGVLAVSGDGSTLLGTWSDSRGKKGHWLAKNDPHLKGRIRECLAQADGSGLEFHFELSEPVSKNRPQLVASQGPQQWTVPLKIDGAACTGIDHQANYLDSGEVVYQLVQAGDNESRVLDEISIWTEDSEEDRSGFLGTFFQTEPTEMCLWLRIKNAGHLKISLHDSIESPAKLLSNRNYDQGLHRIPWTPAVEPSHSAQVGQHVLIKWD